MLQLIATQQHQIVVANLFDRIAHNATDSGSILHKIQFILFVVMQRISTLCLVSLDDKQTVFLGQRRNLCNDVFIHDTYRLMWV